MPCKCGCGTLIPARDRMGRLKHYVKGHQHKKGPDARIHTVRVFLNDAEKALLLSKFAGRKLAVVLREITLREAGV